MANKSKKNESSAKDIAEQGMVQLAEQLGWFLGAMQSKADTLLDNEAVKQQVSLIRDGAMQLFDRVNKASDAALESVNKASAAAIESAKAARMPTAKPAAKTVAKGAAKTTGRSGGTVDAPGKKHRKAPPKDAINKRMGDAVGRKAGQKQFKVGKSRGRG